MNREIKFRAWDKERNMFDERFPLELKDFGVLGWTLTSNDFEFMQYTGLHDKNGREIYEGDVLADLRIEKTKGYVVFHDGAFRLQRTVELPSKWMNDTYVRHYAKHHSVIGNIYQNPELLTTPQRDEEHKEEFDICIHHKGVPCFRDALLEHHLGTSLLQFKAEELLSEVEGKIKKIDHLKKMYAGLPNSQVFQDGYKHALTDIEHLIRTVLEKK